MHTVLRLMDRWSDELEVEVNSSRQPPEYIPNLNVDEAARGPPIVKYRAMLQAFNTPFESVECCAVRVYPGRRAVVNR